LYGFTWVASRKGSEPWKQWHAVDLTRAASRGKPFWHAEAQGGPLWLQPQVIGRAREDGRITEPEDIRVWQMISFAGGTRGLLFPRWRPLLDGPLFGAFGPYAMNGSRTNRSIMASSIAEWANSKDQTALWNAVPIQGEIGILVIPETQTFDYLLNRSSGNDIYAHAMWGAYQGFFDNGIQADWVHIDDINTCSVLYWPYPIMLSEEKAEMIKRWVENGGTLISEGCPAYFGNRGKVGTQQPNHGFDTVFGAVEDKVEFMPDISGDLFIEYGGNQVRGGAFKQSYAIAGGRVLGQYLDGGHAVIENSYGKGKTLLIGSFPSVGYYQHHDEGNRIFFSNLLQWSGIVPHLSIVDNSIQAIISQNENGNLFMWVINPNAEERRVEIKLSEAFGSCEVDRIYWGVSTYTWKDTHLRITLPAKDALVIGFK
jgi:beta-galactosidase